MHARTGTSYNIQHDAFRDMKHMQKRLRNDELRVLRGEVEVDEAQLDNDMADLDTSEDDLEPVRQAPTDFVPEKRSMHTTNKGTEGTIVYVCRQPAFVGQCIPEDLTIMCTVLILQCHACAQVELLRGL